MRPGLDSYLGGSLSLVIVAATLGFGAYQLRRWIVPGYSGALARLAELILATALLVLTLQLLGSVGLLRAGWIPAACAVVGVAAGTLGRAKARGRHEAPSPPAPRVSRVGLMIAVAVASWTVAEWSLPSLLALDRGMFGGDSVWYHMPTAARFAQEGSIVPLHFTDPLGLAVWYYPHTYELLNGAAIAVFESDFLAPLMNMGWLAVGLLAAWCVGRPYGLGPATIVAAALVFNSGLMWETQAGEARNDIMALALLLAFAAFLINGYQAELARAGRDAGLRGSRLSVGTGTLIVAGAAAGLAVSTKLTMLLPVGTVVIGLVLLSEPRARRRAIAILGGAVFVTGAYWYARNLAHSGSPLPLIEAIGPIELPHPDQMPLFPRPPHSVAGYLLDPAVYRHWFIPQLNLALGPFWLPLLAVGLTAAVHSMRRTHDPLLRLLAVAALATALIYIVTPIGASGPVGEPKGFFSNTRYLMTALLVALVLLPLARELRSSERWRGRLLALLSLVFALTALTTLPALPEYAAGAIVVTAGLIWVPLALAWLRSERGRHGAALGAGALAVLALALVVGRAQEVEYVEGRYRNPEPFFRQAGPIEAFAWARETRDSRVGVVGAGEVFFTQYGWYGADLSNHVQYVGVHGPRGAFRLPRTCGELREAVNSGDYDYLVTTRYGTDSVHQENYPVWGWLRDDPALDELVAEAVNPQPAWVYRVSGELDAGACGDKSKRRDTLPVRPPQDPLGGERYVQRQSHEQR